MSNLVFSAGLLSWIGDWFYGLWVNLWLLIDNVVYSFINWMYRVFLLIAKVDIFGSGTEIADITKRLYLIVGVIMLFIFAYNLILLIINPEGKQLGNMGKIVQNALISIILVTLLPTIFSYLTTIQAHVLDSNVIGHLIFGNRNDLEADIKQAGVDTSLTIFTAFYHPEGETLYSCQHGGSHDLCDDYVSAHNDAIANKSISSFVWNDALKTGAKEGGMEYSWILSTIAGVCALWMFVSFGLDIGVRVAKLALYEIISPIPVMMRILPGDKMFDKWFKGITNTFISLFVRLAVIFFCMYAITLLPNIMNGMWAEHADTGIIIALANVVLILGILQFAKEAPGLIGDMLSTGGDGLKLGIASKIKDNKYAMAGMGGIGAGAVGMAGNIRKMFTKGEDGKVHFKADNPFRGVGKAMWTGGAGGYKAKDFGDIGGSVNKAMYEKAEKELKYQSRRTKGKNALGNAKINGIPFVGGLAQNVVGGVIDAKDSVIKGVKKADEYLSGDSNYHGKKILDSFKSVQDKASSVLSGVANKEAMSSLEAQVKHIKKQFAEKGAATIPGYGGNKEQTYTAENMDKFFDDIKAYENAQKKELYKKGIENITSPDTDKVKFKNFDAMKEAMGDALKEAMPMFSTEFAKDFCSAYSEKFGGDKALDGSPRTFDDVTSILSDISKDLSSLSSEGKQQYVEKVQFIESQMKSQHEYISTKGINERKKSE